VDFNSDAAAAAAADLNFVGSFRKLVEHVDGAEIHEFGGIVAFSTRLPISLFNGAVILAHARVREVQAAVRWLIKRDAPFGLARIAQPYPGMAVHAGTTMPPMAPGVAVRVVDDAATLDEHRGVLMEGGLAPDVALRMFPASWLTDPDVRILTGLLDGRPVGTGLAIRTGATSGVYNIGTRTSARRRGVGAAVTVAAVEAGRTWGCDPIVLQSTEMGEPLYRELGFRIVVRYTTFSRAGAPPIDVRPTRLPGGTTSGAIMRG
jgi:GNAT superfamily N-acetyltransferase